MRTDLRVFAATALAVIIPSLAAGQTVPPRPFELDSQTVAGFRWRNVGPANTMGRVSDVTGIPSPSKTFFAAAAAGGIWKSINNGVTWRPVFDNQRVISMGMLAIAPSDTMQVWAGTGEPNSRNTISPGGGVFKSTGRRADLEGDGFRKDSIHRTDRRPSDQSEHRLRRGARRPMEREPGARPLQDRRRRHDLEAGEVRLRQGGRRRRRARSVEPEHGLGGELAARPRPVLPQLRRAGLRRSGSRPTPATRGRK